MDHHLSRRRPVAVASRRLAAPMIAFALLGAGGVSGCSDVAQDPSVASVAPTAQPEERAAGGTGLHVPLGTMTMPTGAQVGAAWAARPDYVTSLPPQGQGAYAFALARPDVLQWLPCYCGCGGMGHGSNLDCFFERRGDTDTFTYEEHASFCSVCVETANLAQQLLEEGTSISEIRSAVDARFGGSGAPGMDTALPPT
jgi:hypothetical protein